MLLSRSPRPGRARVWAAAAAALVLTFLTGLAGSAVVRTSRSDAAWYAHSLEVRVASMHVRAKVREAASVGRASLLLGRPDDGRRAVMLADQVRPLFEKLVGLTRDNPDQQARLANLGPMIDLQVSLYHAVQQKVREGDRDAAVHIVGLESIPLNVRIDGLLDAFDDDEDRFLRARRDAAESGSDTAQALIWTSMVLALTFIVIGAVYSSHQIAVGHLIRKDRDEAALSLEAVTGACPDAYVAIDASSKVLAWNPAAARLFGYTAAETVGRPLTGLIIPPEHRLSHTQGILRYEQTGEGRLLGGTVRLPALCRDGDVREVEAVLAAVHAGGRHFFCAFFRADWPCPAPENPAAPATGEPPPAGGPEGD